MNEIKGGAATVEKSNVMVLIFEVSIKVQTGATCFSIQQNNKFKLQVYTFFIQILGNVVTWCCRAWAIIKTGFIFHPEERGESSQESWGEINAEIDAGLVGAPARSYSEEGVHKTNQNFK